jgi:cytochrome c
MERDMFDTMTMTKVLGGVCGTFLVFLLGGWAAESIYSAGEGAGHEGEHAQAYVISHGDGEVAEVQEGPTFEEIFANADAAAGERVFRKCAACHSAAEGENGTGPSLYGVVNRPVDSIAGFAYSGALEAVADVWTPEHMNGFLENPKGYAPGTAMSFSGLAKVQDRADVIAYLQSVAN